MPHADQLGLDPFGALGPGALAEASNAAQLIGGGAGLGAMTTFSTLVAELVVPAPLFGVREDLVGAADLFEAILGLGVARMQVRMAFLGQFPVRLADIVAGRFRVDA